MGVSLLGWWPHWRETSWKQCLTQKGNGKGRNFNHCQHHWQRHLGDKLPFRDAPHLCCRVCIHRVSPASRLHFLWSKPSPSNRAITISYAHGNMQIYRVTSWKWLTSWKYVRSTIIAFLKKNPVGTLLIKNVCAGLNSYCLGNVAIRTKNSFQSHQ